MTQPDRLGVRAPVQPVRRAEPVRVLKHWWRLCFEEVGVWRRVLQARYRNGNRHEDYGCPSNASIWWKDLWKVCFGDDGGWMGKGLRVKVGEGDSVLFWKEVWAQNTLCRDKFHKFFGLSVQKNATVREMGAWDGDVWRWNFKWRRPLSAREAAQLDHMIQWLSVCPLKQGVGDKWLWHACKDGGYTVRSAYALLLGEGVA